MVYPFSSLKALLHRRRLQSTPPVANKSPFLENVHVLIAPL